MYILLEFIIAKKSSFNQFISNIIYFLKYLLINYIRNIIIR